MIKIIVEETGETKGNKIGVNTTIEVKGTLDLVSTQLAHSLFDLWNGDPKIILKMMEVLDDLISDNFEGVL